MVGVSGMGAIGKSTLAKHFFKERRSEFDRSCYLSKVRESTLTYLQRQLLQDLQADCKNIPNTEYFKSTLLGLKILIVIDDVDDRGKLKV